MFSRLPRLQQVNIMIAMPLAKNAMVHAETASFCARMNTHTNVQWGCLTGMTPEVSRNGLIEHNLHKDISWTHLFFIDSDVVPPNDTFKKMLEVNADVCTGLYPLYVDGVPVWSVAREGEKDNRQFIPLSEKLPDKPFKTYSCGGGCILVRREVLIEIGYPWFHLELQEIYKNGGRGVKTGEDVFFCEKCSDNNFPVIAVPSVQCEHYNQIGLKKFYESCCHQIESEVNV